MSNAAEVIRRMRLSADDPMWADHAEIGKPTLRAAIALLESRELCSPQACRVNRVVCDCPVATCKLSRGGLRPAGVGVPQEPLPRIELELPQDDTRTAVVRWVNRTADGFHVCISVSDGVGVPHGDKNG